jgi:hypothetical protein
MNCLHNTLFLTVTKVCLFVCVCGCETGCRSSSSTDTENPDNDASPKTSAQPDSSSKPFVKAERDGGSDERQALTPEEQTAFLAKRTPGSMMGTFSGYCSLLYAALDVAIHTDSREVSQTSLNSPFPEFYKPTWKELFDSVARQTRSSWKYDPKRDYWVFTKPPMPLPFEVKLAKGWKSEDRGRYVFHAPPSAPVGMDIYLMGTYSVSEEGEDLFGKVREDIAVRFAKGFKKEVSAEEMLKVKVGGSHALHFKTSAPQTGIIWRQWIVVDSGMAFAIVSAIKPEREKEILPDVTAMLKSFTLKTEEKKKANKTDAGGGK